MTKLRSALVTGGSRGIGLAICEVLKSSYEVLSPSREELNLSDVKSIENYFNGKKIDIIVNNAGINNLKKIDEIDYENIAEMIQVNLIAPLLAIAKNAKHMKEQNFGRIINISSIWGINSKEDRTLYSMTKFGLNGVTKALAKELGPYGILVNSICPGYVNTELTNKNVPFDMQMEIKKTIPLRRFAEPSEIAKFVKFLIEDNTYINGQFLTIDGGFL